MKTLTSEFMFVLTMTTQIYGAPPWSIGIVSAYIERQSDNTMFLDKRLIKDDHC